MKAVVDRFGDKPKAYLVIEGTALASVTVLVVHDGTE